MHVAFSILSSFVMWDVLTSRPFAWSAFVICSVAKAACGFLALTNRVTESASNAEQVHEEHINKVTKMQFVKCGLRLNLFRFADSDINRGFGFVFIYCSFTMQSLILPCSPCDFHSSCVGIDILGGFGILWFERFGGAGEEGIVRLDIQV